MRFLLVATLAGLCALSASTPTFDSSNYSQKQKDVFRLFKHINQPSYYKDHQEIAKSYNIHENVQHYTKPEVVEEFHQYYHYGMLQRGEIFSVFHKEHLHQAVVLFKLFYYADSWETFYKTAVWARNNVNEGMFVYAFSVAIVHRPDTFFITLPPIYEIYPHYFFNSEVIHKAQEYKQLYSGKDSHWNEKTIFANYSGHYLNLHPEQSMSYYTEDVGINAYYYYYQLYYPFWMDGEEFHLKHDNHGELYFHIYKQILARYYMERLSNGFGEIEWFDWETPFETGYHPSLVYPNGLHFPVRPHHVDLHEYFYNYGQKWTFKSQYGYSYTFVKDYEKSIREAIFNGYFYDEAGNKVDLFTEHGLDILGQAVEGNYHSNHYYKYVQAFHVFARHLLGYAPQAQDWHKVFPSALEHIETSLRDPAFYQLYKKLMMFYVQYKHHQKPYTYKDLAFEGVKVTNVEFDHLTTFFDYFYSDITNAVYVTPEEFVEDSFKVQVAQHRLNHKPFTYKIHVHSDKDAEVSVKVFLGPKYDEYGRYINLTENWMNFVQFDHFIYHVKSGENVISRDSKTIVNYMHDRTSYYDLYKKAFGAYDKSQGFHFYGEQIWFGFPQRHILPVGSFDGTTFQFYVFVNKIVQPTTHEKSVPMVGNGVQYVDGYPMGYPFDRFVRFEQIYEEIPNGYFHDVKVYHENSEFYTYHH